MRGSWRAREPGPSSRRRRQVLRREGTQVVWWEGSQVVAKRRFGDQVRPLVQRERPSSAPRSEGATELGPSFGGSDQARREGSQVVAKRRFGDQVRPLVQRSDQSRPLVRRKRPSSAARSAEAAKLGGRGRRWSLNGDLATKSDPSSRGSYQARPLVQRERPSPTPRPEGATKLDPRPAEATKLDPSRRTEVRARRAVRLSYRRLANFSTYS